MAEASRTYDLGPVEDAEFSIVDSIRTPEWHQDDIPAPTRDTQGVLTTIQRLNRIRDLDTLLEQVLLKARQLVRADAGTIYLKAKNRLFFSYVQNDTLFAGQTPDSRYVYSANSLPIDRSSLAGYVASTGEPLVI
ncbi:MAG: GAF domain-containing protein, partial [Spirochaetota bacterium]